MNEPKPANGWIVKQPLDGTWAGRLAPDAPAPLTAANGNPVWRADNTLMVTRYPDGEIAMLLNPKQEARYTPQAARDQAALLLAAANHREAEPGMSTDFIKTMNSAWARGRVQQADLDVFKTHGANVPDPLYAMAGNGELTMGRLLGYWELKAINPQDAEVEQ